MGPNLLIDSNPFDKCKMIFLCLNSLLLEIEIYIGHLFRHSKTLYELLTSLDVFSAMIILHKGVESLA